LETIMTEKTRVSGMLGSRRCGAATRGGGGPCRCPAVAGKRRCRLHGGSAGSGAPKGNRNALKSGDHTKQAIEARRALRDLLRAARKTIEDFR
jgi:hypothetical protein